MKIEIELYCPHCQSAKIKKNGRKSYGKQNYHCKKCYRQFIGDHALDYKGCLSALNKKIELMLVRGVGIRDIAEIGNINIAKVLSVLIKSNHIITPKKKYYGQLEIDEFWTYVGSKKNKVWLLYAYDRETREIVYFVWGKRDLKTAWNLRKSYWILVSVMEAFLLITGIVLSPHLRMTTT